MPIAPLVIELQVSLRQQEHLLQKFKRMTIPCRVLSSWHDGTEHVRNLSEVQHGQTSEE